MHNLVVGITGSGKSRLVRDIILPGWLRRGYATLVLDPVGQPWPGAAWQTKDPLRFLEKAKASNRCILVIDEAEESLRGSPVIERQTKWLATQARNWGHVSYFLGQRVMMMPPSVRGNCQRAYVFQQSPPDAEYLASQMNQPPIAQKAPTLPLGVCMVCQQFQPIQLMRVFHPGK